MIGDRPCRRKEVAQTSMKLLSTILSEPLNRRVADVHYMFWTGRTIGIWRLYYRGTRIEGILIDVESLNRAQQWWRRGQKTTVFQRFECWPPTPSCLTRGFLSLRA